ncbi:1-phosphatidylinositol 4 [Prionailurus iriomotensis]
MVCDEPQAQSPLRRGTPGAPGAEGPQNSISLSPSGGWPQLVTQASHTSPLLPSPPRAPHPSVMAPPLEDPGPNPESGQFFLNINILPVAQP